MKNSKTIKIIILLFIMMAFVIVLYLVFGKKKETALNSIVLEGNPTTGYEWTCISNDTHIVLIDAGSYVSTNQNEDLVGVGGTYTFKLTGVKEGETTITCKYARSWETTDEDEEKVYKVKVNDKLEIIDLTK